MQFYWKKTVPLAIFIVNLRKFWEQVFNEKFEMASYDFMYIEP